MTDKTPKKGRFFVGSLGVDSGTIFLSDPCYIKHHPELYDESQWGKFVDAKYPKGNDSPPTIQMFDGICTSTNFGDGEYPVYTTFDKDGSPTKIEVIFTRYTTEADEAKEVEYQ